MSKNKCVYILKDINEVVLYIGVSVSHKKRIGEHVLDKEWSRDIHSVSISEYMHENLAFIYEIYYISKLEPKYNSQYNSGGGYYLPELENLNFKKYDHINKNDIYENKLTNDRIKELSFVESKVLLFLITNKTSEGYFMFNERYLSVKEMCTESGVGDTVMKRSLKTFEEKGYIKKIRKGKLLIKILIDL